MKYFKYLITENSVPQVKYYTPEGLNMYIPDDPNNMDYARMMEEVEAGTSTIEEIDDTPE
jgi:hypothetical protein